MNCTKCGKEIPEGEKTVCEDCEKKFEVSSDKTEKNSKLKLVIAIAVAVVILAVIVLCVIKVLGNSSNIGNSIGNIRNYGYGASDGKWIYYLSPNEDSTKVGISKVKNNGDEKQELLMDDMDIVSINSYKNYIYFIGIASSSYSETDEIDNKIYKMKKDGSDLEVINDNEFNNECYEIYALNNSIYYIGVDQNIYKMNLDGTNRELVSENGTGYIGITNKYIIYNVQNEAGDNYITHIMNIDGSNSRAIIENERLYSVDVSENYIYYTNAEKQIYKTEIDSGEQELILDTTAYNLNLKDNYLYFLNYADVENEDYTVCLYRIKADGSDEQAQNIKTLSSYSGYINLVGDWVMYMDSDDNSGFINLVKSDASGEEKKIYTLNYEEYYNSINDTEDTAENVNTDGQENENPESETPDTENNVTPEESNTAQ